MTHVFALRRESTRSSPRALWLRSHDRRRHAVEPIPKMLRPARLAVRADRGIDRGLPRVPALGTSPLIDDTTGWQVRRVHGSLDDPPARVTALRSEPGGALALVLSYSRGPAALELAPKMQGIKDNVQRAPPVYGGERGTSLGQWRLSCRASDTLDMVSQTTFARARS